MGTPHPVEDPQGYQRFLLSKLGDDDPALVQEATPSTLRALFEHASDRLRTPPVPGEWSVLQVGGHILDGELVASARYRWILAHDEPPLVGYDQDLWVERLRHNDADPGEILAVFEALREANLALWSRSSSSERARVGVHAERGPESYELTFRLMAGHDRNHLEQARAAIEGG